MEKFALTNTTEKLTQPEKNFVSDLKHLAGEARRQAYRSADHLLVVRNWLIGWRIVTQEQNGKERAKYGEHVLKLASQTLTDEYGRGFGLTSIKNMRSFYLMFNKLQMRACQNTQYKNIKLVVCPFMDAQRVFHFSVNLTFKSLVGNKYCVYRHK